jgi:isocitrate lyase
MFKLARAYREWGMSAYADFQEGEFKSEEQGYRAVKHQEFVGTGFFDEVAQVISSGSASTLALTGSTEEAQFHTRDSRTEHHHTPKKTVEKVSRAKEM